MIFNENEIYVIAEIGVNHNGSVELAKELILKAKECGADAVKFQTFKAEDVLSDQADMAAYQKTNTGKSSSQLELVKKLELSFEDTRSLRDFSEANSITFISTPFDNESLDFLSADLNVPFLKVSSADISNLPFLYKIALTGKPVILSTGTASLGDIEKALSVFTYVNEYGIHELPTVEKLRLSYSKQLNRKALKEKIVILHCVTQYPATIEGSNLLSIRTIHNAFGLTVGYSDHTLNEYTATASVALGATVFEKHITLDKKMEGPDHAASMEIDDFKRYVSTLRQIKLGLGDGIKFMQEQEKDNFSLVRRSLVARTEIKEGEVFSEDNVVAKRAGKVQLLPEQLWELIGKKASKNYKLNELIEK
ncbi:N-acetylneuraminate synthase [Acinetobacter gerneri]|uniref:N-acetylneuraminate synthase n=1 Tax=Acinetobacter gerneri TaxID=202952 RepID=UPI003A8B2FB2